jgi:hypothetical protein
LSLALDWLKPADHVWASIASKLNGCNSIFHMCGQLAHDAKLLHAKLLPHRVDRLSAGV